LLRGHPRRYGIRDFYDRGDEVKLIVPPAGEPAIHQGVIEQGSLMALRRHPGVDLRYGQKHTARQQRNGHAVRPSLNAQKSASAPPEASH